MEILVIVAIGLALLAAFGCGVGWTRYTIKNDPAKLDKMVRESKEFRDRVRDAADRIKAGLT